MVSQNQLGKKNNFEILKNLRYLKWYTVVDQRLVVGTSKELWHIHAIQDIDVWEFEAQLYHSFDKFWYDGYLVKLYYKILACFTNS